MVNEAKEGLVPLLFARGGKGDDSKVTQCNCSNDKSGK